MSEVPGLPTLVPVSVMYPTPRLMPEVPGLPTLVPVSVMYPTPRPPVLLGCRYCYDSSYARSNPLPNPIPALKMLRIRRLFQPRPGEGIPLPGGCLSCFLRPGRRFVADGATPPPLSGSLWKMIDPFGFLPLLAGKPLAAFSVQQVFVLSP